MTSRRQRASSNHQTARIVRAKAQSLGLLLVRLHLATYFFSSLLMCKEKAIAGASKSMVRIPRLRAVWLRQAFSCVSLAVFLRGCLFGLEGGFFKDRSEGG